jgi:hypothetical protein
MDSELTYRISILRLFSETLKRIPGDPQTPPSVRKMIDEVLLWGKDVFPFVFAYRPEDISRLRQVSDGFGRILGHIAANPKTPHSVQTFEAGGLTKRAPRRRFSAILTSLPEAVCSRDRPRGLCRA